MIIKKIILLALIMFLYGSPVYADLASEHYIQTKIDQIGTNILNMNKIQTAVLISIHIFVLSFFCSINTYFISVVSIFKDLLTLIHQLVDNFSLSLQKYFSQTWQNFISDFWAKISELNFKNPVPNFAF